MNGLQGAVTRALDVLGIGWRPEGTGVLRVWIPPGLRRRFNDRKELRVAFDPEVWAQDRRTELVAPGSAFLEAVEKALGEGSGGAIRVSGVLLPLQRLGADWTARVAVENARLISAEHPIRLETAIRFLFEVELPGPPPGVELVAVGCATDGRLLTSAELAALDPAEAYDLEEVAGLLSAVPSWPGAPTVKRLRDECRREVERRVAPLGGAQTAGRLTAVAQERRALEADRQRRVLEAENAAERTSVETEHARRLALLEKRADSGVRVRERTVTLLVAGRETLTVRYAARDGREVSFTPRMAYDRLRADQCGECSRPAERYVLAPPSKTSLWCVGCARACVDAACAGVMRLGQVLCGRCESPRWCSLHQAPCSTCGILTCPDHRDTADCCGKSLCSEHVLRHSTTGGPLCADHARPCSVDDALFADAELATCSRTGVRVCEAHRVTLDLPAGAIVRLDRARTCAESQRKIDVDLSGVCTVDGQTYEAARLRTCPVTGLRFHPLHGVEVLDDKRELHPLAILRSTVSGMAVARDRAVLDAFAVDDILHPSEAVRCAVSGEWTARIRARQVVCCHETVAVVLVVRHAQSGVPLCPRHAFPCAMDGGMFTEAELVACGRSGSPVCEDHRVTLEAPRGLVVRGDRVRICAETGQRIDQDDAGVCSVDGSTYTAALLAICPITGLTFHPKHAIPCEGDARVLHPSAVLHSWISGRPVARDRRVPDAFAEGAPLHPDEAICCAVTKKWTARARSVVVECCNEAVALPIAQKSTYSGRPVCPRCGRACDGHAGLVLPEEAHPCALSGASWCSAHIIRAACGQSVGPDRAVRLPDGLWECDAHYRPCRAGDHVVAVPNLDACHPDGKEYCAEHRRVCGCHGRFMYIGDLREDLYDGSWWCPDHVGPCGRCGIEAPSAPSSPGLCRWCSQARTLATAEADVQKLYHTSVVPLLPWYLVRMRVNVSGTSRLVVFQIATLTGQVHRFRVTAAGVQQSVGGGAWR